jgi:hypothetical protein
MRKGKYGTAAGWEQNVLGEEQNSNRYLNCFIAYAAELDLDWALWTLVGSYYYRQGIIGMEEFYGVLNWDWTQVRNATFMQRIYSLQLPFRGNNIITPSGPIYKKKLTF